MRVLVFDLETQGFEAGKDRITEIGAVLWDTDRKKPLLCMSELLWSPEYPPQSEEILRVTGITDDELKEFGYCPQLMIDKLNDMAANGKADFLCGHNINNFDKPFLLAWATIYGVAITKIKELPVLDTRTDLPFPVEPDSRKLKHLAADHGFLNPFAHRALFDSLTTAKLLSMYDINAVIELSKIPMAVMRALVSYDQREMAKTARYMWEKCGDKTFTKCWVKLVRQNKIDEEMAACKAAGFQSVQIA